MIDIKNISYIIYRLNKLSKMCKNIILKKVKKPQNTILQEYQHRGHVHTHIILTSESSVLFIANQHLLSLTMNTITIIMMIIMIYLYYVRMMTKMIIMNTKIDKSFT